ncbi:UNVERIFIED_CONTAM: putative mitochondrial protein [Sesamum latifolium]|uniref:Mitochondrial protein n=1 Tax=Sesamum latifolium TaxID=2727402 RepID=A0AAW2Y8K6_9LAMI
MANRLKPFIDSNVSQTQSAFIPNRLITDNVLLAFEINHHLKISKRSKGGSTAIKLDMSKAYDSVEWSFLRGVLLRLGFHHRFVNLIMLLVSTVSYSFTLNGEPFGFLRPERGIRQGDPLSPYLFIFCAETLSRMMQEAECRGRLMGVKVMDRAPSISHLLFADDTLIFCVR